MNCQTSISLKALWCFWASFRHPERFNSKFSALRFVTKNGFDTDTQQYYSWDLCELQFKKGKKRFIVKNRRATLKVVKDHRVDSFKPVLKKHGGSRYSFLKNECIYTKENKQYFIK